MRGARRVHDMYKQPREDPQGMADQWVRDGAVYFAFCGDTMAGSTCNVMR
jgi:hypothetical protein